MSWEDTVKNWTKDGKTGECRVMRCDAKNCEHNIEAWMTGDGMCSLDTITIDSNAKCASFKLKADKPTSPSNVGANLASPGLIDRATRNLREQERNQ